MTAFQPDHIRTALARLTLGSVNAQENLVAPDARRLYLPWSHRKAFDWDTCIVIGIRGSGKSLWTAALNDLDLRQMLGREWSLDLYGKLRVRVAFGLSDAEDLFPSPETLAKLHSLFESRHIWRAVAMDEIRKILGVPWVGCSNWYDRTTWVKENPEGTNQLMSQCDRYLLERGERLMFLFDTLERLSVEGNWEITRQLLKGALQFALSLRSTRSMRAKLFLRPDMDDDLEPWTFPESSKLKQSRAFLSWGASDLFALVLQTMANDAEFGSEFQENPLLKRLLKKRSEGGVAMSATIASESEIRPIIEEIAGPFMGRDRRRGLPYTWIPNHLADAKGQASPRSFLIAFSSAAEESISRFRSHEHPLHYTAISMGVAKASEIRLFEITKEDYPWVAPLLEALRDLTVPCRPEEMTSRWTGATFNRMNEAVKLPPRRFTTDPVRRHDPLTLIEDLEDLAVLSRAEGGRINMPDIFRIAANVKRKGGVPVARKNGGMMAG